VQPVVNSSVKIPGESPLKISVKSAVKVSVKAPVSVVHDLELVKIRLLKTIGEIDP
jgi:hypothetical protein